MSLSSAALARARVQCLHGHAIGVTGGRGGSRRRDPARPSLPAHAPRPRCVHRHSRFDRLRPTRLGRPGSNPTGSIRADRPWPAPPSASSTGMSLQLAAFGSAVGRQLLAISQSHGDPFALPAGNADWAHRREQPSLAFAPAFDPDLPLPTVGRHAPGALPASPAPDQPLQSRGATIARSALLRPRRDERPMALAHSPNLQAASR